MNAFGFRFGSAPLWLAAIAALVAVIGWETDWGAGLQRAPEESAPPAPKPVEIALLPEYQIPGGIAARSETVQRPAFVPTRRPAPPATQVAAQEAAKSGMQRGQFLLTGTAVLDKGAIAFLRETAGGKPRSVRRGEVINGLTVAEVGPDRVKLSMGNESEELILAVAGGPRSTIQPPQPAMPGAAPGGQASAPGMPVVPGAPQPPQRNVPSPTDPAAPAGAVPGLVPGQATGATQGEQSLLERRRAARAAQATAEVAGRSNDPAPVAAAATARSRGAAPPADPAWADVYRRMQRRNP